jgi:hypothetical protein
MIKPYLLLTLSLLAFASENVFSQSNLVINMSGGNQNTYDINSVQNLTFPSGIFRVNKTNATHDDLALNTIDNVLITKVVTNLLKETTNVTDFTTYPNPFIETLHVACQLSQSEAVSIAIFKTDGTLLLTEQLTGIAGTNSFEVPQAANLMAGTYLIRIASSNKVETLKLIKI